MSIRPDILERLQAHFPDAKMILTDTTGTDDHWDLKIASDHFKGMSKIKQHQAIYAPLKDLLASNRLHALNIQSMSLGQWSESV